MPTDTSGHLLRASALVDAHIHPDKTSWGLGWQSRASADTLPEFIANDLRTQRAYTASVEQRSFELLSNAVANGTLAMRAHVDVSSELGTANVEGVRAAAERLSGAIAVQIVAFPQFGLLTNPGTADVMAAALDAGADLVGGIDPIGLEHDLTGHLDVIFGLAQKKSRDLDIHIHDGGEEGLAEIRQVAARTRAAGMGEHVTVSHAFALCDSSVPGFDETVDAVAAAGVRIATCALGADPVPDLDLLADRGVRVVVGSDGVRDSWSPFGTGSMVDRTHLLAYRTGAMTDEQLEHCYHLASTAGADLLGVGDAFAAGDTYLEFVGESLAQVVADRPKPVRVVSRGVEVPTADVSASPVYRTAASAKGL